MAKTVLVLHGVANRDKAGFEAQVAALGARMGADFRLLPVFWGDLGGNAVGLTDTLPSLGGGGGAVDAALAAGGAAPEAIPAEQIRRLLAGGVGPAGVAAMDAVAAGATEEAIVVGAAREAQGVQADAPVAAPGTDTVVEAVRSAVKEGLPETKYLQHVRDPELLEAVGRALGAAAAAAGTGLVPPAVPLDDDVAVAPEIPVGGGELAPGEAAPVAGEADSFGDVVNFAKNAARRVLDQIDTVVGHTVENVLGPANQRLRSGIAGGFSRFFGDIFTYQRNQAAAQQRLWDALGANPEKAGTKENPVYVMAHSLGGVVAFDAMIRGTHNGVVPNAPAPAPLWVKSFLTFGSQAAFFHVLDRRQELATYTHGNPVTLPPTVGGWTNLWDPMDLLAFTAGVVFRLSSGGVPQDKRVDSNVTLLAQNDLWVHSNYWEMQALVDAAKAAFA